MTKRLSPERIAEIRGSWNARGHVGWEPDLVGHIESIEAELQVALALIPDRNAMCIVCSETFPSAHVHGCKVVKEELAEAKAEIARLTQHVRTQAELLNEYEKPDE